MTRLRDRLVDRLKAEGTIRSPAVEAAMRAVPREVFASWLSEREAYANKAVRNPATSKENPSTISQPTAVALFLEGFGLEPGMNVLEIGAGTGYQAALVAHIVGTAGRITTIDITESLVKQARRNFAHLDIENASAVLGDGALGYPEAAPYDRIVATVGIREVPMLWSAQLKPGGRIAAPLHLGGEPHQHVLVSLAREGDGLTGRGLASLNMVILQGAYADLQEEVWCGEDWRGGYAHELRVQVRPKDVTLEPSARQKLIHKGETTVLVEV